MEVHHHSHKPKDWKEYITEFVMLFAAVTLGFFAENQREHYVERHREVQYMESLMEDLAKDKYDIGECTKFTITQIGYIDTAITLLSEDNWTPENIKKIYRASLKVSGNRPSTFIDRTSAQLRSGGMRLIEDKKVATLITEYWQLIAQFNEYETVTIHEYKMNVKNMTYKIFDGTKYLDAKNKIIKDDATLMTYEDNFLKEYLNRLLNLNYDLKAFVLQYFYKKLDNKIDELQSAIASKYHIDIEKSSK
ncbi:MAG: hypothetical protein NTW77_01820 [Bacteroidetes bacterium]|jgi:hypothetical protein|nr:hypothetical protein [Bacteroidota bacterium]